MTPNGVVRTEAVPEGESITAKTGHKLDYAIVAGLVLLSAMVIWQQMGTEPVATDGAPVDSMAQVADTKVDAASIAVLPFADLSPAGDQEYFSDGISEEILNVLVAVDGLEVTSRTSAFQFKGGDLGIPAIAKSLNVRHVVEGSVRKSGETIRVTAQLIDAENDKHLWSQTYDRPLNAENIFSIQDEIANSIVDALSTTLGVGSLEPVRVSATTSNLSAYELYLQARPLFQARFDLDVADDLLRKAVDQDPRFANAWAMRAALQWLMVSYGYSDTPKDDADRLAKEFAHRALELDPQNASAMIVIALVDSVRARDLRDKGDFVEIIETFDHAMAIEPRNATALLWRGLRLLVLGYLEPALADFAKCMEIEPFYVPCAENHYSVLANLGRDEEAMVAYTAGLDKSNVKVEFSYLPLMARMDEELAFKLTTNHQTLLLGWRQHGELYQAYKEPNGDHSELIESIRRHFDAKKVRVEYDFSYIVQPIGNHWRLPTDLLLWDVSMSKYRQSDEFKSYIRESGIFDYWQAIGYPPQCRAVGNNDFKCD
jgi:TolB-like protein